MPRACLEVLCAVKIAEKRTEGNNRGRGAFSKRHSSHRSFGKKGVWSTGSVLKVEKKGLGGGSVQLTDKRRGRRIDLCKVQRVAEIGEVQALWNYN